MIVAQIVKCLECGRTIQSKHRHDYQVCGCDNHAMVDGGLDYCRGGAKDTSMVEHTVITSEDPHELIRKHLFWGKNYDKNKKLLPETQWSLLCEMDTDHIEAIVSGGYAKGEILQIFKNELEYRK